MSRPEVPERGAEPSAAALQALLRGQPGTGGPDGRAGPRDRQAQPAAHAAHQGQRGLKVAEKGAAKV
mgnify:CR=1 FL=1